MTEPSRRALESLREKYVEMLRMRREHEAGFARDPKSDMRRLAQRFPGALREIDELPLEEIEDRVAALDRAVAGEAAAPLWARYFVEYHGWMRAALRLKRACLGCGTVDEAVARVRRAYAPAEDEPPLERLDEEAIRAITRPAGGRLNPWVFARIAEAHGVSGDEVRRILFPPRFDRSCTSE